MKTLICIIGVVLMGKTLGYAQEIHDLTVHEIVLPEHWVEDGASVIPVLKIVNLGNAAEENVPVMLKIVDEEEKTIYNETVNLERIGFAGGITPESDTAEVIFPLWLPVGACEDWEEMFGGPPDIDFVGTHYEVTGIVLLAQDQNRENDTLQETSIALLSYDVGLVGLANDPSGWVSDNYGPETEYTCVATVENFGFKQAEEIYVDLQIFDVDMEPDSLVWRNIQEVYTLNWRGSELDLPYVVDVTFPSFATRANHQYRFEFKTEFEGDECPTNDEMIESIYPQDAETEIKPSPRFSLRVTEFNPKGRKCNVMFSIPQSGFVELGVYDATGLKVATLAERRFEPGSYSCIWSGTDDAGNKVSSGVYLIRMEAGEFEAARKAVVID